MKLKSMGHKKNTAANCVRIPTPKVYHKSPDLAQARRELQITVVILILSILANMIMFIRIDQLQTKITEINNTSASDTEQVLDTNEQTIPTAPAINKLPYETMSICSTTSTFKSWMDYRMITSTSSRQWKLQQTAITDEYGFRLVDGYYTVAMAKMYGPVGTKYILSFSGGQSMDVIIGDVKANTDCSHSDGSMLEIIIDSTRMPYNVKRSGNYNSMITGTITEIRKVN